MKKRGVMALHLPLRKEPRPMLAVIFPLKAAHIYSLSSSGHLIVGVSLDGLSQYLLDSLPTRLDNKVSSALISVQWKQVSVHHAATPNRTQTVCLTITVYHSRASVCMHACWHVCERALVYMRWNACLRCLTDIASSACENYKVCRSMTTTSKKYIVQSDY